MTVDNFDEIVKMLRFDDEQGFYFVQVIQRKKDHSEKNKLWILDVDTTNLRKVNDIIHFID